jgi:hypothetical protein
MNRRVLWLSLAVFSISALPIGIAKADVTPIVEIAQSTSGRSALRPCASPAHLTCIESLSAILPNGTTNEFKLLQAPTGSYLDSKIQVTENSLYSWSFIDVDGSTRQMYTDGNLSGENYRGEQVNFNLQPKMTFAFVSPPVKDVTSGIKFKFVFRSSWVVPVAAFLMASNAEYKDEKIENGHRYTYIGSPFVGTNYVGRSLTGLSDEASDQTKSDSENIRMYFLIDHASSIPGGSYGDTRCSKLGYPVTSHNAYGGGIPHLVDNDTMKFEIYSPHLLSTGALTTGFFSTYMSVTWMDCMWPGNNVSKSPKVEVSVINSDGTTQVATTSFKIENGFLVVNARGFHFSSPTVQLKAIKSESPTPAVSASPEPSAVASEKAVASVPVIKSGKKVTISCIKMKTLKKITGINPKCPSGYTKK